MCKLKTVEGGLQHTRFDESSGNCELTGAILELLGQALVLFCELVIVSLVPEIAASSQENAPWCTCFGFNMYEALLVQGVVPTHQGIPMAPVTRLSTALRASCWVSGKVSRSRFKRFLYEDLCGTVASMLESWEVLKSQEQDEPANRVS